ncbi:MAG TPA: general stress protein, partial [Anaerolineae bacterium]
MPKIVVALYRELNTAEEVVRELVDNGFRREDIGLVAQNREGTEIASGTSPEPGGANTAAGAGAGAVLGGLAGLVVGLGALAIPGIGPIIAAGPLATALAGAGIGAVAGGLIGALTSAGVP